MSVTGFFRGLGAPLRNAQWSWGAQRESDGAVFMKVWQDLKFVDDGRLHFLILGASDADRTSAKLGYSERLKHIEAARAGAPCYLVMCRAKNPDASPRQIADLEEESVFVGGEICERSGDLWMTVAGRKSVAEIQPRSAFPGVD